MEDRIKTLQKHWRWLFALGATTLGLGMLAIISPFVAILAVEMTIGIIFVVGGAAHALYSFWAREWGGFLFELFCGILYLLVGLMLLANPGGGLLLLALLVAILLIMQGIVQLALSFELRPMFSWSWMFTSGIVALLLGVFIWAPWPSIGFWLIGLFVGISLLFSGWSTIILALSTRYPAEHEPATAAPGMT